MSYIPKKCYSVEIFVLPKAFVLFLYGRHCSHVTGGIFRGFFLSPPPKSMKTSQGLSYWSKYAEGFFSLVSCSNITHFFATLFATFFNVWFILVYWPPYHTNSSQILSQDSRIGICIDSVSCHLQSSSVFCHRFRVSVSLSFSVGVAFIWQRVYIGSTVIIHDNPGQSSCCLLSMRTLIAKEEMSK